MKKMIVLDCGAWEQHKSLIEYQYDIVTVVSNCDRLEETAGEILRVISNTEYDYILIASFHRYADIIKKLKQQGVKAGSIMPFNDEYMNLINDCPRSISDQFASPHSDIVQRHREIFGTYTRNDTELFVSSICRPTDCYRFKQEFPFNIGFKNISRKTWEHMYIYQALKERGMLKPGKKGLGFACGTEPSPALFANMGCHITATDAPLDVVSKTWGQTRQHSNRLDDLFYPAYVDADKFYANTEFKHLDMNHIPYEEKGYDFIWSACALEHLGSLHNAKQFIYRSMECLKEGGVAVHTTEYNLSSSLATVMSGDSCIFRSIDLIEAAEQLERLGYHVEPLDFRLDGSKLDDLIADTSTKVPHFKLFIDKFLATSFGLIIKKPLTVQ